ncbi:hypothetical protein PCAR4_570293 [Paraburkholderia caribensis]|nr:hypothetical protein PCAR4_570293 [Paraburkholderia caribensis]
MDDLERVNKETYETMFDFIRYYRRGHHQTLAYRRYTEAKMFAAGVYDASHQTTRASVSLTPVEPLRIGQHKPRMSQASGRYRFRRQLLWRAHDGYQGGFRTHLQATRRFDATREREPPVAG